MNPVLGILNIFPELFNVNGDAENAAVLAARSRWAGHSARVTRFSVGDVAPDVSPGIIVIGSTTDAALPSAIAALREIRAALAGWIESGVPVLAVGTGWELLSESIELTGGTVPGLGLVPGRAVVAAGRVTDDLVVDTRFGRLVGFENHARDFELVDPASALGTVIYGRGNGTVGISAAAEGFCAGSVIATHLHGPVLAKNPALADHILSRVLPGYDSRTVPAGRVDDFALAARNVIAGRLELPLEAA
jgi:CobQ-like glutamine amidotransferase family enzyme